MLEVRNLTIVKDGHELIAGLDLQVGRGAIVTFGSTSSVGGQAGRAPAAGRWGDGMMIESSLTLRCLTQDQGDFNRGIVRLDPGDMKRLGLSAGARVAVRAGRAIYAVMQPATKEHRNQGLVLLDDLQLHNCGVKNGDMVKVLPAPEIAASEQLTLAAQHALDARAAQARLGIIRAQLEGQVVSTGDVLRVRMADQYDLMLQVTDTGGNAPALVRGHTVLQVTAPAHAATPPAMAQLGGLRREFHWLEEWLQSAHAAPQRGRGLVLESAAGCGKIRSRSEGKADLPPPAQRRWTGARWAIASSSCARRSRKSPSSA